MLAHFFEGAGLATTQISLIRLHTEKIKPPRALWVPFELGHPLGMPDAPLFQKKVLLAALKLLEAAEGPILADFAEEAPVSNAPPAVLACPVNIRIEATDGATEAEKLCTAFKSEIMSLRPWYDMAVKKRGRTTVGVSQLAPAAMGDFICSFVEGNVAENPRQDISLADELRFTVEDLKAYYFEAVTAQPGMKVSSARPLLSWFWGDTIVGKTLLAVGEVCAKSADESLQPIGRGLIASSAAVSPRH
ncbi:MAG: hypothetical protein HYU85_08540 [Chloroflexi bacterium]|nr:hypothetical protein [Chloroflexota bacterium]